MLTRILYPILITTILVVNALTASYLAENLLVTAARNIALLTLCVGWALDGRDA